MFKEKESDQKASDSTISDQSLAETAQSVQAIVEANNKEWEKKFQKTVSDYE